MDINMKKLLKIFLHFSVFIIIWALAIYVYGLGTNLISGTNTLGVVCGFIFLLLAILLGAGGFNYVYEIYVTHKKSNEQAN